MSALGHRKMKKNGQKKSYEKLTDPIGARCSRLPFIYDYDEAFPETQA